MLSRSRVLVLLILLLAFGLRLTVAQNNLTTALAPDEREYTSRAALVAEDVLQDRAIFRPPLYPYALALVFKALGQARFLVSALNTFADVTSVALMYALTGALVRRRTGRFPENGVNPGGMTPPLPNHTIFATAPRTVALVAALLYAVSPTAIGLTGSVLSDTLFICFALAGFVLALRASDATSMAKQNGRENKAALAVALLAGVFFALAALTREVIAYFALVIIPVWWLVFTALPRRTRILQTAALLAGMALLLVPWAARNQSVAGRFLLISSSSEYNFARDNVRAAMVLGAVPDTADNNNALNQQIRGELDAQPPYARAVYAYRRGLSAIAATGWSWLGYKARSLGGFWNPAQFEKVNLGVTALPGDWIPFVSMLVSSYWVAVLVFGILGFVAAPDPAPKLLLALFLLYSLVLLLLTHYQLRYRFPVQVLMLPYAAYGMWVVSEMVRRRTLRVPYLGPRRLGLALVPLVLSVVLMTQAVLPE